MNKVKSKKSIRLLQSRHSRRNHGVAINRSKQLSFGSIMKLISILTSRKGGMW